MLFRSRDITITPQLKTDIKAGETVDKLLLNALTVEGDLLDKDRVFFEYAELANGSYGNHYIDYNTETKEYYTVTDVYDWGKINKYGGYPAFRKELNDSNGNPYYVHTPSFKFQVNDKDLIKNANQEYLRFGSKYAVKLDNDQATPLADSYNVTYNPASLTVSERGQGKVTASTTGEDHSIALKYAFDGGTYTIKPREAAPFID